LNSDPFLEVEVEVEGPLSERDTSDTSTPTQMREHSWLYQNRPKLDRLSTQTALPTLPWNESNDGPLPPPRPKSKLPDFSTLKIQTVIGKFGTHITPSVNPLVPQLPDDNDFAPLPKLPFNDSQESIREDSHPRIQFHIPIDVAFQIEEVPTATSERAPRNRKNQKKSKEPEKTDAAKQDKSIFSAVTEIFTPPTYSKKQRGSKRNTNEPHDTVNESLATEDPSSKKQRNSKRNTNEPHDTVNEPPATEDPSSKKQRNSKRNTNESHDNVNEPPATENPSLKPQRKSKRTTQDNVPDTEDPSKKNPTKVQKDN